MKRIAIIGAGGIACSMARTVNGMKARGDEIELYAIASRDLGRAEDFAARFGVAKAYGSYEAMLADPLVDLAYIATPHAFHGEQIKLCADYGKPSLVEKAFTGNARQAREALAYAAEKGVMVTEAIWTRYMPARGIINKLIAEGVIGEVRLLSANLGYDIQHVARIQRPELAGGALLDLGVYPLNFAVMVLGDDITDIRSTVRMQPTGCDLEESIHLTWSSGVSAMLFASAVCRCDRRGIVYGSKARLEVDNINNPQVITCYDTNDRLLETLHVPQQITGYEYEVESALRALDEGRLECPEMPHEETLRIMTLMDALRAQWGMVYPFD